MTSFRSIGWSGNIFRAVFFSVFLYIFVFLFQFLAFQLFILIRNTFFFDLNPDQSLYAWQVFAWFFSWFAFALFMGGFIFTGFIASYKQKNKVLFGIINAVLVSLIFFIYTLVRFLLYQSAVSSLDVPLTTELVAPWESFFFPIVPKFVTQLLLYSLLGCFLSYLYEKKYAQKK